MCSNLGYRFPNFFKDLKNRFPHITPAETRLVLLLKTEFEAPEIANITGVSLSSVYKSRYRLRQKFNLTEDVDLEMFVKSL